jgi:hypothetical protein
MSFGSEFPSLSMKARTVSVRVDGWQLRSLEYSMVITGSVAAAGFVSLVSRHARISSRSFFRLAGRFRSRAELELERSATN